MVMKKQENLGQKRGTNETGVSGSFYVTAGEQCKVIGLQDGSFPDFGHHLRNEMGGVWVHPIKVADAFWLKVGDEFHVAKEYETLPYGNRFYQAMENGWNVTRYQISPDETKGVIIRYELENTTMETQTMPVQFIIRFDVLPVWFSKENGILDSEDEAYWDEERGFIIAKDGGYDWFGILGTDRFIKESNVIITKEHIGKEITIGRGVSAGICELITLEPGQTKVLNYYLAGSDCCKEDAVEQVERMRKDGVTLEAAKKERYEKIKAQTNLTTNEPSFDEVFEWVKYNTDWLIANCGQYGRALMAGIPEYPWWFGCDNAYSVQGLLAMGEFELAKQTLCLLKRYSEKYNGNGRILHEITTNGMNAHSGNTQETGHFITAVYHYLRWTKDLETVRDLYDYCEKGIKWLMEEMDTDGDLLPSGYGIIEIKGLNVELIDTAVYTCQALLSMDKMAQALGCDRKDYLTTGEKLKNVINTWLWKEKEGLFVDAVATPEQILERVNFQLTEERYAKDLSAEYEMYLRNLKEEVEKIPKGEDVPFLINKNWVINTPMETQIADWDKGIRALTVMDSEDFIGEYGMHLAGYMHDYTMTISTGVQAVAQGRYGRTEQTLDLLERMFKTFGKTLPGSMNEMSPDYGCFTQAWTVYATMVPVVECLAGIVPQLEENKVFIRPSIPKKWNKMNMERVRVGEGWIDIHYAKEDEKAIYEVNCEGLTNTEVVFVKNPYHEEITLALKEGKNRIEV